MITVPAEFAEWRARKDGDLHTDADVRRLLDVVVGAGALDAEAARGWVVTRCVDYWLWGLECGLTIDPARCERILGALLPAAVARD